MRSIYSLLAIGAISVLLCTSASAQTSRSVIAESFVVDAGSGNKITIQAPASLSGATTWSLPLPPAGNPASGFVGIGTSAGQTLSWNASGSGSWVASAPGLSTTGGTMTGLLTLNSGVTVTDGAVVLSYNHVASGSTLTGTSAIVNIDDNATAGTGVTATLPGTGTNGQVVEVSTSDPDGATVSGLTFAKGTIVRFVYSGGSWNAEF